MNSIYRTSMRFFSKPNCRLVVIWIVFATGGCVAANSAAEGHAASSNPQTDAAAGNATPKLSPDEKEIRRLIADYVKSVDAVDTALASRVWSQSPEASSIYPLGEEHGWQQIKENLYIHLMGEMFSERDLRVHDISVHVYGMAAWSEFSWDFQAKFKKDGSPVANHGKETQVYHKEKNGWRLVHVHYSAAPAGAALGL